MFPHSLNAAFHSVLFYVFGNWLKQGISSLLPILLKMTIASSWKYWHRNVNDTNSKKCTILTESVHYLGLNKLKKKKYEVQILSSSQSYGIVWKLDNIKAWYIQIVTVRQGKLGYLGRIVAEDFNLSGDRQNKNQKLNWDFYFHFSLLGCGLLCPYSLHIIQVIVFLFHISLIILFRLIDLYCNCKKTLSG